MLIKIIFVVISIISAIIGIVRINGLPKEQYSYKQNYWRIAIYSTISAFLDFIMFTIILFGFPEKEITTSGIETIISLLIIIIYTPVCIITTKKLKQRIKNYDNDRFEVKTVCGLISSLVVKIFFAYFITIWIVDL